MPAHGGLDLLALHRGEVAIPVDAAPARAGVDGDGLARQRRGQRGRERAHRIVVLAENDAAVVEPGFPLAAMLGEKIRDGCGLGVAGFRAGQLVHYRVEVAHFFGRHLLHDPFHLTWRFLVVQRLAPPQLLGCGAPGGKARADTLQEQRLHESRRLRTLVQGIRKRFRCTIGQVEGVAGDKPQTFETHAGIGSERGFRVGMHIDADPLQKPRLLQRAAPTQHSVPHDGVLLAKEAGSKRFSQPLLLDISE